MSPAWDARAALASGLAVAVGALLLPSQNGAVTGAERTPRPALKLPGGSLTSEQKIERTGNRWAVLFAASYPTYCDYMTQHACEREWQPALRRSFRAATVRDIAIDGGRARARFSNGKWIALVHVNGYQQGGVWWIDRVAPRATVTTAPGSARYGHVTGVGRRAG